MRSGCAQIVLTDEARGRSASPLPMILATGGVHTHLVRHSLRTFTA